MLHQPFKTTILGNCVFQKTRAQAKQEMQLRNPTLDLMNIQSAFAGPEKFFRTKQSIC
jgi:hypothetical protein